MLCTFGVWSLCSMKSVVALLCCAADGTRELSDTFVCSYAGSVQRVQCVFGTLHFSSHQHKECSVSALLQSSLQRVQCVFALLQSSLQRVQCVFALFQSSVQMVQCVFAVPLFFLHPHAGALDEVACSGISLTRVSSVCALMVPVFTYLQGSSQ